MKKAIIFLLILFNFSGLLTLATFKDPSLLPSYITYWSLQDTIRGFKDIGWYQLLEMNLIILTFLVSTFLAILIFFLVYYKTDSKNFTKKPLILVIFFSIAEIAGLFTPALCSEGGCIDIGGIFMLIIYAALQVSIAFLVARFVKINSKLNVSIFLFVASILLLAFSSYFTANCGYYETIQDRCHYQIADNFIKMEECKKISASEIKNNCISQVDNRNKALSKYLAWKNIPEATMQDEIDKCKVIPIDEMQDYRTRKEACYKSLIVEASIRISTLLYNPCTADSIHTLDEEADLIQCLRTFSTSVDSVDDYKSRCQKLNGVQKENCLRIVKR